MVVSFDIKKYKKFVRYYKIIKEGTCHYQHVNTFLNDTYHYFCLDMIDKGWKRETVNISNDYNLEVL